MFESFTVATSGDIMDPMDLHAGRILKTDDERRVAYGWASVVEKDGEPVVDSQGDVIDPETLLTAAHEFVVDSRAGRVLHKGRRVADVVESVVFTADLQKALGIDLGQVGWFVGMRIRDDETWDRVKKGELRAFSVGGTGRRDKIDKYDPDQERAEDGKWSGGGGSGGDRRNPMGSTTVSETTINQKFRDGDWEAISDATRFGRQEVRDMATGRRFTVTIKGVV